MQTFRALADPHRRILLDALRTDGELSLGALCDHLPISRQSVSKHLQVLVSADLVRVRRAGRERLHSLHAAPLHDVAAWVEQYSAFWTEHLDLLETQLQRMAEGAGDSPT